MDSLIELERAIQDRIRNNDYPSNFDWSIFLERCWDTPVFLSDFRLKESQSSMCASFQDFFFSLSLSLCEILTSQLSSVQCVQVLLFSFAWLHSQLLLKKPYIGCNFGRWNNAVHQAWWTDAYYYGCFLKAANDQTVVNPLI